MVPRIIRTYRPSAAVRFGRGGAVGMLATLVGAVCARRRRGRTCGCVVVSLVGLISAAFGQADVQTYSPTSTTDVYGNAEPVDLERRAIDVYQNRAQREALSLYQEYARRLNRRGALPFSVPGDPRNQLFNGSEDLLTSYLRRGGPPRGYSRQGYSPVPPQRQRAFAAYGGFGDRRPVWEPGTLTAALARRQALISATSLNAPVYRALLDTDIVPRPGDSVAPPPIGDDMPTTQGVALSQRLRSGVVQSYASSLQQAWGQFSEGRYRLAIRYFQTASSLRPNDIEPRLGELYACLAIGAVRSAAEALGGVVRRTDNPFALPLNLIARFRDRQEALRVRLEVQLLASGAKSADARAVYAMLLWHLGEPDEAMAMADAIRRDTPASMFANWPQAMRTALGAIERTPPTNQP